MHCTLRARDAGHPGNLRFAERDAFAMLLSIS
jgi:hypothetical protein